MTTNYEIALIRTALRLACNKLAPIEDRNWMGVRVDLMLAAKEIVDRELPPRPYSRAD